MSDHGIFETGEQQTAVCGTRPGSGETVEGPALIEDGTSTLLIANGWSGTVDEAHNLILRKT